MIRASYELMKFFNEHNVPTDNVVFNIDFSNSMDASRFEMAVMKEFGALRQFPSDRPLLNGEFECNGLTFKVKDPNRT